MASSICDIRTHRICRACFMAQAIIMNVLDSERYMTNGSKRKLKKVWRLFANMDFPIALTYDDVLLVPKYSTVKSRAEINLRTRLTKNIWINNPIVSANMDTVSEAEMCIAMARNGGIGIIHRFNSIEEQAEMVRRVKRAESYRIDSPYTCAPNLTVGELRRMMREKGVGGILVVDPQEKHLLGIASTRDLLLANDNESVIDIMTLRSEIIVGSANTTMEEAREILREHRLEKLPLVDAEDRCIGLITAKDILYKMQRPDETLDADGKLLVGAAIGVKDDYLKRAAALVEAGVDVLVIDIAHGHSSLAIDATRTVKRLFPTIDLIAGNVATAEGTEALAKAGADAIKVGVGPGSICITRDITGCGVPQLTAVMQCAKVASGRYGIPIIADGGIRKSGDITKAIAAGADTVMLGSLLAGTDESPGDQITKGGQKVKIIRGMAGYGANLSKKEKTQDTRDVFQLTPEGVEAVVPYRGKVADVLHGLIGGLKSGISYCGATDIAGLKQNAEFCRITSAGQAESTHHDVKLI